MAFDSNKKSVWLNPEILQWSTFSQGGSEPEVSFRSRAYEIWSHAEQVLSQATSDLQLVDVITTLKRSVDQRIRALDEIYSFEVIPMKGKPTDVLGLLESLDIVRPLMFRNLLEIRNAVEHEDASPPDLNSSQVFLEFAWYFLRSTDRMLQIVPYQIGFYPSGEDEDSYWIQLDYGPEHGWNPTLRGWIRPDLICNQPMDDWIILASATLETGGELIDRLRNTSDKMLLNHHSGRNPDDLYFQGGVRGPQNIIVSLTKIYFSV